MIYSNSFVLINNKMKKIIFSFVSAVSLVFVAESVTYMRVNTTDGKTVLYEVNNVETVDFFEAPNDTVVDGVSVSGYLDNYAYVDLGLKSRCLHRPWSQPAPHRPCIRYLQGILHTRRQRSFPYRTL